MLTLVYYLGPLTMLLLHVCNLQFNPGPLKFCHLNACSILAGVDLDDQYSLLRSDQVELADVKDRRCLNGN